MILALVLFAAIAAGALWYRQSMQRAANITPIKKTSASSSAANNGRRSPLKKAVAHKVAAANGDANKFHAVSIVCKDGACSAAKEIAQTRFLTQAAPVLPLPSCDAAHCHCAYAHHRDRRDDEERRSVHSLQTELYPQANGNERRQRKSRRKHDVKPNAI